MKWFKKVYQNCTLKKEKKKKKEKKERKQTPSKLREVA